MAVIGVSLGGASALLAESDNVDAFVLESVFTSLDVAVGNRVQHRLGPLAPLPTKLLLVQLKPRVGIAVDSIRPIDKIGGVDAPTFVISGSADHQTTPEETRKMFARRSLKNSG